MRPETLDAALAWLAEQARCPASIKVSSGFVDVFVGPTGGYARHGGSYGDIPAAIVSAVGEVWDQVNGKGNDG